MTSAHSTPTAALRAAVREVTPPEAHFEPDLGRFVSEVIDNLRGLGWELTPIDALSESTQARLDHFRETGEADG